MKDFDMQQQQHILIKAVFHKSNSLLTNTQVGFDFLHEWIQINDMTLVGQPMIHKFDTQQEEPSLEGGYSGIALLCESHVSIHTYPETGTIYADIFSCKELNASKNAEFINTFTPCNIHIQKVCRDTI